MEGKPLTCALVASSEFNDRNFVKRWSSGAFRTVVAVDGGYAHLQEIECVSDIVIGDFDSLGYVPSGDNVLVYPAHKDKSDLELALDWAQEQGFETVYIYGALGGRLDHTLANLQMCARFAESGMTVTLVGLDAMVRILVGPGSFEIPFCESGVVSVFSAVDESVGVTERGMEYPLVNARLDNRTSFGLSNELVGQPASVSLESGTLYVFHPLPVL